MKYKNLWDNASVLEATGGKVYGEWSANGIAIDSRNVKSGDIFVAIKGEKFDGHDFVLDVLEVASAVMVERIPEGCSIEKHNIILVKDVLEALRKLAEFHRKRCKAKIIAVTGSLGKTSTKEQLKLAFTKLGKTYSSEGNFNSQITAPIGLALMPLDTEFGIFELGMSQAGEITKLTKVFRPDLSIITTVAAVHLENFSSVDGIARAKAEIFLGMNNNGIAILNGDNKYIHILENEARKCGMDKILKFGEKKENDAFLISYHSDQSNSEVSANILGKQVEYTMLSPGKHHAINSIAVLLSVESIGLDTKKSSLGLKEFTSVKGRGLTKDIMLKGKKKITLIDDSYNASVLSIKAALDVLSKRKGAKRKVVILADMYELGEVALEEHKGLLSAIENSSVDKVITVGPLMKELFDILPTNLRLNHFND
ncbi:MAG: UDP-N-acetylmuramoyl-tripeptide--D-alanyl-D-alanine ligase [Alphaproteobacteria bacterium]|nr:UDP-N-acetylmuramoyl-tripeptide--D-alanyl-D-alanine ligase [Alphaproteobacteria bacterium]